MHMEPFTYSFSNVYLVLTPCQVSTNNCLAKADMVSEYQGDLTDNNQTNVELS